MMKATKTKAQIRNEINEQVQQFLAQGGAVNEFQAGESGRSLNAPLPKPPHIERNPTSRTPVLTEIQAIEARRHKPKRLDKHPSGKSRTQRKLLTDDFGEPLRWLTED